MSMSLNQLNENLEKKKRFDAVLGIILAAVLGFLLNLAANLYYDLFVVKTVLLKDVSANQVVIIISLMLVIFGFLQFFVRDYKNDLELNLNFWKRFYDYFFNKYLPVKLLRWSMGVLIIIFFVVFLIAFFMSISGVFGYKNAIIMYVIAFSLYFWKKIIMLFKIVFKWALRLLNKKLF